MERNRLFRSVQVDEARLCSVEANVLFRRFRQLQKSSTNNAVPQQLAQKTALPLEEFMEMWRLALPDDIPPAVEHLRGVGESFVYK